MRGRTLGVAVVCAGLVLAWSGCARDAAPIVERTEPAPEARPTPARAPTAGPAVSPEPVEKPAEASTEAQDGFAWVELAPGLRVDRARRVVEFDGFVPWQFKDPEQPVTFLEAIVCKVDSKEHESLVATSVRPSLVHGALLSIGLEPGRPGRIGFAEDGSFVREGPRGARVIATVVTAWPSGEEREVDPLSWVVRLDDGVGIRAYFQERGETIGWRFGGSVERDRGGRAVYEADVEGVVVGLHTFGSAVIGFEQVLSPDSGVDDPEWIADVELVPPFGERVRVRLRVAD